METMGFNLDFLRPNNAILAGNNAQAWSNNNPVYFTILAGGRGWEARHRGEEDWNANATFWLAVQFLSVQHVY